MYIVYRIVSKNFRSFEQVGVYFDILA